MSQSAALKNNRLSQSNWKTIDPSAALSKMQAVSLQKNTAAETETKTAVQPEWSHTVLHTSGSTLDMIWHKKDGMMTVTVPCASSWVDNEYDIQRYLREHLQKFRGVKVSFERKQMVFECVCPEETLPDSTVKAMEELIERAGQYFDLLPACMCCQRTITVEVEEYLDEMRTVCGICRDERRLRHDHERLIEQQKIDAVREWKEEIKQRQPINDIVKIGLKGGLMACGLGFVFFVLALYLPMFHYMPCFPGAVAALYIVTRLWNIGFYTKVTRFIVATLTAMLTMFIVSGAYVLFFTYCLPIYHPIQFILFPNMGVYNLVIGMFGYLLMAAFTFMHGE